MALCPRDKYPSLDWCLKGKYCLAWTEGEEGLCGKNKKVIGGAGPEEVIGYAL
jgi:hypothetical protein